MNRPDYEPPDLAAFIAAEYDRALRVAGRLMGGRWDAAEDVVHDAFVRATDHLSGFRGEASLKTWFYRVLTSIALTRHRRARTRERVLAALSVRHADAHEPAASSLRDDLIAALESLSPRQRSIFVLVALEGFTLDEAAAASRCAPGTARSHHHRALVSLRAALAHTRDDDGST